MMVELCFGESGILLVDLVWSQLPIDLQKLTLIKLENYVVNFFGSS